MVILVACGRDERTAAWLGQRPAMRGSATPPPQAALQDGVFTVAQALAAGYSHYRIRNLVRQGRWIAVLGSVHADRRAHLTHASLARASVLVAGAGAVASHATAARLWDLDVPPDPDVHAIVDPRRRIQVPGLRLHRIAVTDSEVGVRRGVVVTRLDRTVADCLLWFPGDAGRALVTHVVQRRIITLGEIRRALQLCGQRHGSTRAWSTLADADAGAHSVAELKVHRLLQRAGVTGWVANVAVHDQRGLIGYADLLFDDARLVVEIDGRAHHSDPASFQRDRERQNRLVRAGYTVLRFTWDDIVRRPDVLVSQVCDMTRGRRRRAG
jgi:very-short-patch-repair endonuclease